MNHRIEFETEESPEMYRKPGGHYHVFTKEELMPCVKSISNDIEQALIEKYRKQHNSLPPEAGKEQPGL